MEMQNLNHMANIRDLKKYKQQKNAQIACEQLQGILNVVNLSIRALDIPKLSVYMSAQKILKTLKDEKVILEAHLSKCTKIKNGEL